LSIQQFTSGPGNDIAQIIPIAAHGVEGAITNVLERKNASSGFWSGVFSTLGSGFKPAADAEWTTIAGDDLAQGIVGGLGSMNKGGKGFMPGFWSAESKTATDYFNRQDRWIAIAEDGVVGGAASRFSGKTFSSGLFTGAAAQALSAGISWMEKNPEKAPSTSGPVNSAFKLLQPKIGKKGVTYPINSITGGYWALGSPWEVLY
jgi:hypothetical protein